MHTALLPSSRSSRWLRIAGASLVVLFMGACSSNSGAERAHYPMKSDTKPHPGVKKAQDFPVHGIDVSKWQGEIDWQAVKTAGTRFVYLKATEGGDHLDERFLANWHAARAAGIPRGVYHFMFWCRPADEQAAWFKQNVPKDPGAMPPVLDVEWNGHSRTCPKKIDPDLARKKMAILIRAMIEHTGKQPIIYTDITFHAEVLKGQFVDHDFWLRSVAAEPHERYDERDWLIWQYTTTGKVPGIAGAVDRNAFRGSHKQWQDFLKANKVQ